MRIKVISMLLGSALLLTTVNGQEKGAELLAEADRVMGQVEKLRGMTFKRPVKKGVYTREKLKTFLLAELDKEMPDSEAKAQEQALKQFGLLPAKCDLKGTLVELLAAQIAGFYNPETGTFNMLSEMAGEGNGLGLVVMAHELTHALDDQYFDLQARLDGANGNSDREFAVTSLVEGSAVILMMRYMTGAIKRGEMKMADLLAQQEAEAEKMEQFFAAPPYLAVGLLPPYTMGMHFLCRGKLKNAMVNCRTGLQRGMRDLPRSSEQILHPEKYWDEERRDDPVEVVLPAENKIFGAGWKLVDQDTLGEINCALLARPRSFHFKKVHMTLVAKPKLWTNQASAGWGGDTYGLYKSETGRSAVVWATAWDSEKDAREFCAEMFRHRKELIGAVKRQGKAMVFVFGLKQAAAMKVAERVLVGCKFRKSQPWSPF